VFAALAESWGKLDFLVHSLAYSDRNELKGRYVDISRANFLSTLSISCYSFTDVARRAAAMMTDGGAMVTLTYGGSTRVMPNYNVMGVAKAALEASVRYLAADLGKDNVRVNAISAGPMRTLAGSAVGDARLVFKWNKAHSPLKKNIELDHVGGSALYLLSELSAGVTGEIHFVDAGYHVIGMPPTSDLKGWIAPENGDSE
jgi:enoyl-[acyl-carrier protein] reductase I